MLITLPTVEKGTPAQLELDISELEAIISDPYYSDSANWKSVTLVYRSTSSTQSAIVSFNPLNVPCLGTVSFSDKANNDFELSVINIFDFDRGIFPILRADIPTVEDFDINLGLVLATLGNQQGAGTATITGSSVYKTAGAAAYNVSVRSTEEITSGDGFVQFEYNNPSEQNVNFVAGLSSGTQSPTGSFDTIDYGVNINSGGVSIYENGGEVLVLGGGTIADGTIFKVAIEGSNVVYYQDNVSIRTTTLSGSYSYYFEISMFGIGAGVDNVVVSS